MPGSRPHQTPHQVGGRREGIPTQPTKPTPFGGAGGGGGVGRARDHIYVYMYIYRTFSFGDFYPYKPRSGSERHLKQVPEEGSEAVVERVPRLGSSSGARLRKLDPVPLPQMFHQSEVPQRFRSKVPEPFWSSSQ